MTHRPPSRGRLLATLLVALLAAAAFAPASGATVLKRLDFESGSFSQWRDVQAVAGGAVIVRSPVRQGRYAAKFTVHPGDRPIGGTNERAEVFAATGEREGVESWWRWSTYFPTGFHPNVGSFNIFTQWHHSGTTCSPPVTFEVNNRLSPAKIKLRAWGGQLRSDCMTKSRHAWNFIRLRRNHWYHFVFHVKWSASSSRGFVQLWVNGRLRIRKVHVATLYKGQSVYIKQGFYRNPSSLTTVIVHDGLQRFRP